MFLLQRFRDNTTQNVHGSNKFLDCAFKSGACCLFSCRALQRETRGGRGEFISFITEGAGGGGGERKSEEMKRQECVFFSALLSKERGKLSFLTAGL